MHEQVWGYCGQVWEVRGVSISITKASPNEPCMCGLEEGASGLSPPTMQIPNADAWQVRVIGTVPCPLSSSQLSSFPFPPRAPLLLPCPPPHLNYIHEAEVGAPDVASVGDDILGENLREGVNMCWKV